MLFWERFATSSQKMNDPTVPLWIITEDDGRILCALIAADVWLAKGKAALTLLACYFTLKLLREYEESYLAPIKNVLERLAA